MRFSHPIWLGGRWANSSGNSVNFTRYPKLGAEIRRRQCRVPTNWLVVLCDCAIVDYFGVGKRHCRVLESHVADDYMRSGDRLLGNGRSTFGETGDRLFGQRAIGFLGNWRSILGKRAIDFSGNVRSSRTKNVTI